MRARRHQGTTFTCSSSRASWGVHDSGRNLELCPGPGLSEDDEEGENKIESVGYADEGEVYEEQNGVK